jgi:hypothetical protein
MLLGHGSFRVCDNLSSWIGPQRVNPAEMPVLQPTKFEMAINLKTTKTLGVKISDNLLSLADKVIE